MSSTVFARARPVVDCSKDPVLTKQEMKDECDINNILARHKATGMVSHVNSAQGSFSDVAEIGDFRSAVQRVQDTQDFFYGLPAKTRAEFDNDPAVFLDAMASASERELEEAGLGGLRTPKEVEESDPTPDPVVEGEAP